METRYKALSRLYDLGLEKLPPNASSPMKTFFTSWFNRSRLVGRLLHLIINRFTPLKPGTISVLPFRTSTSRVPRSNAALSSICFSESFPRMLCKYSQSLSHFFHIFCLLVMSGLLDSVISLLLGYVHDFSFGPRFVFRSSGSLFFNPSALILEYSSRELYRCCCSYALFILHCFSSHLFAYVLLP